MAHVFGDLTDRPPVGSRFPGHRQERALTRDATFGVGDGTVLLAPGRGRQQDIGEIAGVGIAIDLGDHHELAAFQRRADPVGVRQADHRIGGDDPHGLDATVVNRFEQVDRLVAGFVGDFGTAPETTHQIAMIRIFEFEVRGELVGEAADLAAAHGIGLAGNRERAGAGHADTTGGEVAVDDRVAFVDAGRRLVDALREGRDHAFVIGPQPIEVEQGLWVQSAHARHFVGIAGTEFGRVHGFDFTMGVVAQEAEIEASLAAQIGEQAVEQPDIGARCDRQVQVGLFAGGGAARVDHHQLHRRTCRARRRDALVDHRVAPGGIRAHQHDQVRLFQILVAHRYQIGAEGPLMRRHRRGHA